MSRVFVVFFVLSLVMLSQAFLWPAVQSSNCKKRYLRVHNQTAPSLFHTHLTGMSLWVLQTVMDIKTKWENRNMDFGDFAVDLLFNHNNTANASAFLQDPHAYCPYGDM